MAFWQWLGFALTGAVLCLVVRRQQPEVAGVITVVVGAVLLAGAMESLSGLTGLMDRLATLGGLHREYLSMLLKVLGMSCAADLAAQTCEDLGEKGLALKVGLAGKWCMFGVIAPMLLDLLETILRLVP